MSKDSDQWLRVLHGQGNEGDGDALDRSLREYLLSEDLSQRGHNELGYQRLLRRLDEEGLLQNSANIQQPAAKRPWLSGFGFAACMVLALSLNLHPINLDDARETAPVMMAGAPPKKAVSETASDAADALVERAFSDEAKKRSPENAIAATPAAELRPPTQALLSSEVLVEEQDAKEQPAIAAVPSEPSKTNHCRYQGRTAILSLRSATLAQMLAFYHFIYQQADIEFTFLPEGLAEFRFQDYGARILQLTLASQFDVHCELRHSQQLYLDFVLGGDKTP